MRALKALAARMTRVASPPEKGWAVALTIVATRASATSPNESNRRKLTPLGTRRATLAQNHRHPQCLGLACCFDPRGGFRGCSNRCVTRRFAEIRCKVAPDLPAHLIA